MENKDPDEPQKKRAHYDPASSSSPEPGDAAVLRHQNRKLVQQVDEQKHHLLYLEAKLKELRDKKSSCDSELTTVNRQWSEVEDDMALLGVQAGASETALRTFNHIDQLRGSVPSCPAADIFLCRLLRSNDIGILGSDGSTGLVQEHLSQRHSFTMELMKNLEDAVEAQRAKIDNIAQHFLKKPFTEDPADLLVKVMDVLRHEVDTLQKMMGNLQIKNIEYADEIKACIQCNITNQSDEIQRLLGELDERMVELGDSRRKLVNLKLQRSGPSMKQGPASAVANENTSPENSAEWTKQVLELKVSIEAAKALAENRQAEVEEMKEDNLILLKQLHDLENEVKDDKYVFSSRPYTLLNDQLQYWTSELEKHKAMADSIQVERSFVARREKELTAKMESAEALRKVVENSRAKIEELENQLQKSLLEKNEIEIKLEEALQDSGTKDVKAEFQIMASAISKEMGMMKAQLNRWKETAEESIFLQEKVRSLTYLVDCKTTEEKDLAEECDQQTQLIKSLKAYIEKKQKENEELQAYVDMVSDNINDNRDLMEIRESEENAHAQIEMLKNALAEHNLELRVKAAKEAEAACEERLAAALAEKAQLITEVDECDRNILKLREGVKIKEAEAEAYISEIENIGQAYEDMRTQNQRLLQLVTDRDDHNIKLVSESVKAKQTHNMLQSEKQSLAKQLQEVTPNLESLKFKMASYEQQMKNLLEEATRYVDEDRQLAVSVEASRRELVEAEKEVKWLKSAASSTEKEYEQIERKKAELRLVLEAEKSATEKIDEEMEALNKQIIEMSAESEEAESQRLQDEIKECKSLLKCGVCVDRPKDVLIAKCYHLFCNQCIQRNLEIRHRKCPACGTAFGQNDVKHVQL